MIDRRTFLLSTAVLLAGLPEVSRARPRHYSIGSLSPGIDLTCESVELLRGILPRVQCVGLMHDPDSPGDPLPVHQALRLAEKIGVRFMPRGVRRGEDVEPAFGTLAAQGADAVIVPGSLLFAGFHGRIVEQAAASRLPALYGAPGFAEAGGLVSVSPVRLDPLGRAATSVARMQPGDFELVVNLQAAKVLGIAIPQLILLRADRVIE